MKKLSVYVLILFILLIAIPGFAWIGELHDAAEHGDIEKARSLLNKGANVNARDSKGNTPLHVAAKYGKKDIALLLIEKGANVNAKDNDEYGITPLDDAVNNGYKEVAQLLIEKGANVNAKKRNTWTALHDAAFGGKKDIVFLLIEKGANVNEKTGVGDTPLHMAAYNGHKDAALLLIEKGAYQTENKDGFTQLHVAARQGKTDVVRLLIEKGWRFVARDNAGRTPLHWAASGGHKEVAQLLIEKGADVNAKMNNNWTPLHDAAFNGSKEIVQLLIEKGADVNSKDNEGFTPLHRATNYMPIFYKGDAEATVLLLLKNGADVNAKTNDGDTPLHFAVLRNDKVKATLIEKGADVNAMNFKGQNTPLHIVSGIGNKEFVLFLIERGTDPGIANKDGKTPLKLAQEKGHTTVALILEEAEKEFVKKLLAKKTEPEKAGQYITKHAIPDFKSAPRLDDLAVIIGIENYQGLPKSDYSKSDAGVVKEYFKALGFQERNIELITDEKATGKSIEKVIEAWLPNRVKKDSRVIVYYSGHGAPEPKTGDAYIVPYDGDPNYLEVTGYPLKRLYEKLGKLEAAEVIVLLDSCFSGAGGRSVLAKGARPLVMTTEGFVLPQNIAVLSATQGTQISSSSPEKGHGIFTYYFLKALKDGKKSLAEIYEYIKPLVEDEAKQINVQQSPSISPDAEKLKGRFELRK
ncbi:MAG: ankyrin repeat domain-containing protein [Thermodesulfobacteriota bacterium]